MGKKIYFIHAYWQRCGNNYVSGLLKSIHGAEVPVEDMSEFPFPSLLSDFFRRVKGVRNKKYGQYILACVSHGITKEIKARASKERIIIKNTSPVGNLADFIKSTNEEKHFLLVRDPRDVAYSYFASMKRSLSGVRSVRSLIKSMLLAVGYYHCRIGMRIRKSFVAFNELGHLDSVTLLRYEDLIDIDSDVARLLNDNRQVDEATLDTLRNLPVYNTSFKEEIGATKTWAHNRRTKSFKPQGRWENSGFIHYLILTKLLFPKSFLSAYGY